MTTDLSSNMPIDNKADDVAAELMITIYWLIDVSGSIVGVISNFTLIMATIRTSGKQMQSYSYLFLVTAIFDLLFSVVEILTQHQLVVRKGIMFVLPHGIEQFLPASLYWVFMLPHGFVTMHGLFMLGAQYKYRHDLITKPGTSLRDLLKAIAMTAPCGLFTGISLAYSIYESKQRGDDYYRNLMNGPWFNDNARRYYMYSCDIRDVGGKLFFYGGLLLSGFWVNVSIYYSWRAWKHVNHHQVERSERTRALQSQFTWSLVIQTINACLFAVIPISLICVAMIFRLDGEFIGMGVMSPLSWLPAMNAILTLYIVKVYRAYVRSLFGLKSNTILIGQPTTMIDRQPSKFHEQSITPQNSIKYATQTTDANDFPTFA